MTKPITQKQRLTFIEFKEVDDILPIINIELAGDDEDLSLSAFSSRGNLTSKSKMQNPVSGLSFKRRDSIANSSARLSNILGLASRYQGRPNNADLEEKDMEEDVKSFSLPEETIFQEPESEDDYIPPLQTDTLDPLR